MFENHNRYIINFSSYDLPEYKNFKTTIMATYNKETKQYDITLTHKNELLLHET